MNPQLALLLQFLVQLRAERLQQEHAHALNPEPYGLANAHACAHQVAIVERIIAEVKDLDQDEGEWIHRNLEKK